MSLLDDIDTYGATPPLQRNMLLDLIRGLFNGSNARDTYIDDYSWSNTASSNNILIETDTKFNVEELDRTPAIIISYQGSQFETLSQQDGFTEENISTNVKYFGFVVQSVFSLYCISETGSECLRLATEIGIRLQENAALIKDNYTLDKFDVKSISPVKKQKDDWISEVKISTQIMHRCAIDLDSLPARLSSDYDF